MTPINDCSLPEGAFLEKYSRSQPGNGAKNYFDCYSAEIDAQVSLQEFVFSFYTTPVFRIERLILKYLVGKSSTDEQARQLSEGLADSFAAWIVEQRAPNQLLMCDYQGRTRSWFMVVPAVHSKSQQTTLYFGSAVVPRKNESGDELHRGGLFRLLLGFHKLYSRILLRSARARLLA
jgi:hypothetical protein